MIRSFAITVLIALMVLFQPSQAFAMSDGNRALMERRQAAEAEAVQAGQAPAETRAGGSGPRVLASPSWSLRPSCWWG